MTTSSAESAVPRPAKVGFQIAQTALGMFLIVAAGLKAYGWSVDPLAQVGMLSAPWFQVLVIQFEGLLGLWLLSGAWPLGAWFIAVLTFTVFAAFNLYAIAIGQAKCGCFGVIEASPWWAFGIDIGVLALLAAVRPPLSAQQLRVEWQRCRKAALAGAGGVAVVLGALSVCALSLFGSLPAALAHLRGEPVSISPTLLDVGEGHPNERKEGRLEVVNRTERVVRVVGGTSDCSCTTARDLPLEIPPGEAREITIDIALPNSAGIFTRTAVLLLDDNGLRPLAFRLTATIRRASSGISLSDVSSTSAEP